MVALALNHRISTTWAPQTMATMRWGLSATFRWKRADSNHTAVTAGTKPLCSYYDNREKLVKNAGNHVAERLISSDPRLPDAAVLVVGMQTPSASMSPPGLHTVSTSLHVAMT